MQGRTPGNQLISHRWLVRCGFCCLLLTMLVADTSAQEPPVHYFQNAHLPPGEVARAQAYRGGAVYGYVQPVHIRAPRGALISIAEHGQFSDAVADELHVALVVGEIYRLRISNIPGSPELEVFPSIEVINRLYPPEGQKLRFPLPIDLTLEDLTFAVEGQLVTRVVYLEDPRAALPEAMDPAEQHYFDVPPDQDPLFTADRLGRPMAIVRMGSRIPDYDYNLDRFAFHCPPLVRYEPPVAAPNVDPGGTGLEEGLEGQIFPRVPLPPPSPTLLGSPNVQYFPQ